MQRHEVFQSIVEKRLELNELLQNYWNTYSNLSTWQFWANFLMLLLPLIVLLLLIDRQKIFELGFYGFSIHSLAVYVDTFGLKEGLWGYPYQLSNKIAANVSLDSSLIPIVFMLIYQYTDGKSGRFYALTLIGCLLFSFGIKPLLGFVNLFWLGPQMSYLKLLGFYVGVIAISIILTKFFKYLSTVEHV